MRCRDRIYEEAHDRIGAAIWLMVIALVFIIVTMFIPIVLRVCGWTNDVSRVGSWAHALDIMYNIRLFQEAADKCVTRRGEFGGAAAVASMLPKDFCNPCDSSTGKGKAWDDSLNDKPGCVIYLPYSAYDPTYPHADGTKIEGDVIVWYYPGFSKGDTTKGYAIYGVDAVGELFSTCRVRCPL